MSWRSGHSESIVLLRSTLPLQKVTLQSGRYLPFQWEKATDSSVEEDADEYGESNLSEVVPMQGVPLFLQTAVVAN